MSADKYPSIFRGYLSQTQRRKTSELKTIGEKLVQRKENQGVEKFNFTRDENRRKVNPVVVSKSKQLDMRLIHRPKLLRCSLPR